MSQLNVLALPNNVTIADLFADGETWIYQTHLFSQPI